MPKFAITCALCYLYVAYDTRSRGGEWKGFAAAGALLVGIVPYTLVVMMPTNNMLHSAAAGAHIPTKVVLDLITKWGTMNLVRSLFPLASAITGTLTFLSNAS